MSILTSLIRWEAKTTTSATSDQSLIDLEANRIKMVFDSLLKQGFSDSHAVQIVAGMCTKSTIL